MKKIRALFHRIPLPRFLRDIRLDQPAVVAVSLVVFVLLNLLLSGVSYRADFSQGKAYTLSPATKKIIRSLDDVVNIKLYVSSDLPTRLTPVKTSVTDFLNEYKKEGGSRINVKIVDPKKDSAAAKEVEELQIPELQFSQLENDKYQISSSYFALGIFYGNKKNVLPQVTDLPNLEYNITSFIYKLTKKDTDRIAIAGIDENQTQQTDPYSPFKNTIGTEFLTSYINPESEELKSIDPSDKALILIAATGKTFTDSTINKVRKYLSGKGKVIVLADGVWVQDDLSAGPAEHNLFSFLQSEGIQLQKNLILSTSAELVNFGNNLYQYYSPYPFWIKATDFNAKTGFFPNVAQLTFPWASSVILDGKKNGTVLVSSPKVSWQQKDTFELYPQNLTEPTEKEITQFPLAVMTTTTSGGTLIVIPSSRFLDARYLGQNSGNIEFMFNVLNNLVSGGALTGIRSRTLSFHRIPDMPDAQKETMKYLAIGLLPLVFGAYGAIRLIRRK